MKRIIYDYDNPHIVGRAKRSFPLGKVIVAIIAVSLVVALIYILFFRDSKVRGESREYYSVVTGVYEDKGDAFSAAREIRLKGGGGYVTDESPYGVIASVYKSKEDALTIAERYGWEVVSTGSYGLKSDYGGNSGQAELRLCMMPEELFDPIYELAVMLDKGETSEAATDKALSALTDEVEARLSELESLKEKNKSSVLLSEAVKMYDKISEALTRESAYSMSSRVKYCLIEVTYIYKSFLKSVS